MEVSGDVVTVTLPAAEIFSNEVLEDSLEVYDETRNLFNPITIEDYTGFTADQKQALKPKPRKTVCCLPVRSALKRWCRSFFEYVPWHGSLHAGNQKRYIKGKVPARICAQEPLNVGNLQDASTGITILPTVTLSTSAGSMIVSNTWPFWALRHVLAVVGRERAAGACEIHHRAVFHREKHCEIGKIAVALGAIIRGFRPLGASSHTTALSTV